MVRYSWKALFQQNVTRFLLEDFFSLSHVAKVSNGFSFSRSEEFAEFSVLKLEKSSANGNKLVILYVTLQKEWKYTALPNLTYLGTLWYKGMLNPSSSTEHTLKSAREGKVVSTITQPY